MKLSSLLPCLLLAACSSGPSEEEAMQIFATTSAALSSGQSTAIAQMGGSGELVLDYTGPCALGGTLSLTGNYNDDSGDAMFDLAATFNGCTVAGGTLDGALQWSASASSIGVMVSFVGNVDWDSNNGSGSCAFDLQMTGSMNAVSYSGTLCGYNVATQLTF